MNGWFEAEDCAVISGNEKGGKAQEEKRGLEIIFSRLHKEYLQDLSKFLLRLYPLSIATLIVMWVIMKMYNKKYL